MTGGEGDLKDELRYVKCQVPARKPSGTHCQHPSLKVRERQHLKPFFRICLLFGGQTLGRKKRLEGAHLDPFFFCKVYPSEQG